MIGINVPAKIRRMSKRRQKIAITRRIRTELAQFAGRENTPLLRAQLTRVIIAKATGSTA